MYRGGGLDLWSRYLGPSARLVGLDIDEAAVRAVGDRFPVVLGDQEDPEMLRRLESEYGPFDVIIDDGGHAMRQQIVSIETLFPLLSDGGTYLVEDVHTSYWSEFGGSLHGPDTFLEWAKQRVDDMHSRHCSDIDRKSIWATHLEGMHLYDSVAVFDKKVRFRPFNEIVGSSSYLFGDRFSEGLGIEILATRDAVMHESDRLRERLAAFEADEGSQQRVEAVRAAEANADELRLARAELQRARQRAAELSEAYADDLGRGRPDARPTARQLDAGQEHARDVVLAGDCAAACREANEVAVILLSPSSGRPRVIDEVAGKVICEHGALPDSVPDRVAILVHYSTSPNVNRSFRTLVREFANAGYLPLVVSASPVPGPLEWGGGLPPQAVVLRKPNVGYDFGSWAVGLRALPAVKHAEHVVLANDSVVGPVHQPGAAAGRVRASPTPTSGVSPTPASTSTTCRATSSAFGAACWPTSRLARFWADRRHERTKWDIIRRNELALSQLLRDEGYVITAAFRADDLVAAGENPVIRAWWKLIEYGFPFVKREIITNPSVAPRADWVAPRGQGALRRRHRRMAVKDQQ